MKTVREITGKPGRMCAESGEQREGGKGGGDEKEVISGLFLTAFCQPPSEIFRLETYRSCVLVKYQQKKGCITAGGKKCVKLASDKEERYDGGEMSQTSTPASVFHNFMSDYGKKNSSL